MLRAWLIVISIATRHNIIQLEGTSVELEVYEMERSLGEKKQSTKLDIREDHSATINVAFLQAVEKPEKEPHFHESYRDGQRKRIYDGLEPEHYFHYEYQLLPPNKGQQGQSFKTDVVVFGGVVSKVYTEKDNRVVQCWSDEEQLCQNQNQFGWRHKHTFKVSKPLLLDLYNHTLEVRVWNSKSKLSARARYDRPKAFRLPAPTTKRSTLSDSDEQEREGEANRPPLVRRPSKLPVVSHDRVRGGAYKASRRLKQVSTSSLQGGLSSQSVDSDQSGGDVGVGQLLTPQASPRGDGGKVLGVSPIPEERSNQGQLQQRSQQQLMVPTNTSNQSVVWSEPSRQKVVSRRALKSTDLEMAEQAREESEGVAVIRLAMADLFAKQGMITNHMDAPVKNIQGLEVMVSMATPLMPEQIMRELNPLTITVVRATGLPDRPISQQELRNKCVPVYTSYQFGSSCPAHRSKSFPHSPTITFNDFHVILLGTFDPSLLAELLRGPPLLVELHDRDRRIIRNTNPTLFGRESKDIVLGTHAFARSCLADSKEVQPWDPYGVANVDLSGLLLGQRVMQMKCPVTCGPRSHTHDTTLGHTSSHLMETGDFGLMSCSQSTCLPPGDYIGSHCELSVVVELTYPLQLSASTVSTPITASPLPSPQTTPTRHAQKDTPTRNRSTSILLQTTSIRHTQKDTSTRNRSPSICSPKKSPKATSKMRKKKEEGEGEGMLIKTSCPFNRLVYVISTEGQSLVQQLLKRVNEINAKALELEDLPDKIRYAALSTYKLTRDQMVSGSCDVITGFHVEDWEQHIVVLEGLRAAGIHSLWQQLPHHTTQDNCILKVFYNSGYSFSRRLYASLDVDLPHICLYQPLSELTQQSLIYVKDSLSQKIFRSLMCLSSLSVVEEMSELFRNDLLPSADEVAALSLQFAQPPMIQSANINNLSSSSVSSGVGSLPERPSAPDLQPMSRLVTRRLKDPLDMTNPDYELYLEEREFKPTTDFIKTNKLSTKLISDENQRLPRSLARRRKKERQRSLSESFTGQPVHLYSSQTLNSTEMGVARVRERLHPQRRYTYCQDYHSMTVVPLDIQAQERAQRLSCERRWRTREGFVYPGVPSALDSNAHTKRPDSTRIQDLTQPFEDNLLHSNTLQPSVDRLEFSWERRAEDFERWKAPPISIGPAPPTTIHLAGESRHRELQDWTDKEHQKWTERLVVKDTIFHTHRQGISSELTQGPTCQLNKLTGLLKDSPEKYSLKKDGLHLSPTPALSVVHNPSVDTNVDILSVSEEVGEGSVFKGYAPGPNQSQSLKRDRNTIPCYGRGICGHGEDTRLSTLHQQDFRLYYHLPSLLYKRSAVQQKEDEPPRGKGEVPLFVNSAPGDAHSEPVAKSFLVQQTTA